jgi:hypothetical protein
MIWRMRKKQHCLKTWTTHAHAHQSSRDFGILNIVFHTTLFPPKVRKPIHGSIFAPTGQNCALRCSKNAITRESLPSNFDYA